MKIMRNMLFSWLPCTVALAAAASAGSTLPTGITVSITEDPQSKCHELEAVERGDVVVMNFNAYIADSSPSGIPGTLITSHKEHSASSSSMGVDGIDKGEPIAVPVGSDEIHPSWDLALIGLCENDRATILIPPKYTNGQVFQGKKLPDDAIVRVEVEIVDILVEGYSSSDDDSDSDDSDDHDDDSHDDESDDHDSADDDSDEDHDSDLEVA
jgi:hypothetical protein